MNAREQEYASTMPLMERLLAFVSETGLSRPNAPAAEDAADERLAIAALLVHVARADGVVAQSEERSLAALLQGRFGLSRHAADDLIARAGDLDRSVGNVAELIERMGHGTGRAEQRRILAMAYAVAAADGAIAEFEEDLIWRVGHLFGFDDAEIAQVRSEEAGDVAGSAESGRTTS